jgi:hypothetical protein
MNNRAAGRHDRAAAEGRPDEDRVGARDRERRTHALLFDF